MKPEDIRQKVLAVVTAVKKPTSPITATAPLSLYGYKDTDRVPILTALETEFGLHLEETEVLEASTFGDLCAIVERGLALKEGERAPLVKAADEALSLLAPDSFNKLATDAKVDAIRAALATLGEDASNADLEHIRNAVKSRLLLTRSQRLTAAAKAEA